jgi:hypothetical protein
VHRTLQARLVGPLRTLGHDRALRSTATVTTDPAPTETPLEVMTA